MAVGEVFLGAFLQVLFGMLISGELLNLARRERIHKKLENWRKTLLTIQAVLNDAEEKQLTDTAVQMWLDDLRDLAFDMDDVLDKFATKALGRKLMAEAQASTSKVGNLVPTYVTSWSPCAVKFNFRSKIKKITSQLEEISQQRIKLGLKEITGGTSSNVWQRPPSTSLPNESAVYGRDEDKKKILELLLPEEEGDAKVCVIPIIGMGGVGKTTLARLVYNDINAVKDFDPKVWVCVSDEFDVLKITKAILESITFQPCDLTELNQVQIKLREALTDRKFLLVLDDVWNKNYSMWDALQPPFRAGAPGSKIIVTTRDTNVALTMGAVECHYLECISDDDCWSVFLQHAFENRNVGSYQTLEVIGRKIVKRCGGLPLAARTLGGLLRCKQREDEWEDILNSKIWSLSTVESDILPVLRLSYHHLPSHLKRWFAYCSILPKDYEFEEKELVLLWMAEGLILQPEGNKQMEDLGREYFRELLSRSFFQQSSRDVSRFVMHDLISDLAQWVAGRTCFRLEDKLVGRYHFQKARHSSYIVGRYEGIKKFEAFYEVECLRTFLPLMLPKHGYHYLTHDVPFNLLPKLSCLRVLSLRGYSITDLPDSIGDLKHLRYLDLSCTKIRSIPESIGDLLNLQTLLLENCSNLRKLPATIRNLVNLHHLDITDSNEIKEMPPELGKLTCLQTLSNFVVGKGDGIGINELKNLSHLRGALSVSRLENAVVGQREAVLYNKSGLEVLKLEWSGLFADDSLSERDKKDVLDMLRPPKELKELSIWCYGGAEFPTWLGHPSFSHMVLLKLEYCENCTSLPSLGQLPLLKILCIKGMAGVERVDPEFYGRGCSKPFPSLETLYIEDMQEWKSWFPSGRDEEDQEFPSLREFSIRCCPNFLGNLPDYLPSLEKLVIKDCEQLVVSISRFPKLCKLEVGGCKEVKCKSEVEFSSLNSVVLSKISELRLLSEGSMQWLTEVGELKIVDCKELTFLWQNEMGSLPKLDSLHHLVVRRCPKFVSLVTGEEEEQQQQGLPCKLESLEISDCESLEKLPQALHSLTSLKELCIKYCPRLVSFPEAGLPSMVEVIEIDNCNALGSLYEAMMINGACLQHLCISCCHSLTSFAFARGQLPPTLKTLEIIYCENLQCLLDEGEGFHSSISSSSTIHEEQNTSSTPLLEYLYVDDCPSLTSLSSRSQLSVALKHLKIANCPKLESVAESLHTNTSLEIIDIKDCENLKSLPEGLHHLTHLQKICVIGCASLVSFPQGGLPTTNLRLLWISSNEKLEALPNGMHNLSSLQQLRIYNCPAIVSFPEDGFSTNLSELCICDCGKLQALPNFMHNLTSLQQLLISNCQGIVSFPEEGFPTNITLLEIRNLDICKPMFAWGLQRLTSLRRLIIGGGCPDVVRFPQEEENMMLPSSLSSLTINDFPNLEYLPSKGFRNLTSLEYLSIEDCPKLTSFPKKGLPPSLLELYINKCPLLKQRCKRREGKYWPMIARIPFVKIDRRFIHEAEEQ